MGSTNFEIQKWGKLNVKHWGGVFSSDTIPPGNTLPPDWSSVINYDPEHGVNIDGHDRDGSHWVGLSRNSRNGQGSATCAFFDSYANKPDGDDAPLSIKRKRFTPWLIKWCPGGFQYNHVRIQAYNTDQCGEFSLWFAKHGLPPGAGWNWVSKDLKQNSASILSRVKLST